MFGKVANIVLALLKSVYGISASVVSGVVNTVVKGTLIVRDPTGTAGTNELQVSSSGNLVTLQNMVGGATGTMFIVSSSLIDIGSTTSQSNCRIGSGVLKIPSDGGFSFSSTTNASGGGDTRFTRIAAGVAGIDNAVGTAAWFQNSGGEARRTATQTVTDSTTFAADNTLSVTLKAGRRYRFYLFYYFTTVNTSGVKIDLNGGGASMTAINGVIQTITPATYVTSNASQITALTSSAALTATGVLHYACAEGTLECLGAGTFVPRFAQNTETGAAESVIAQIGSFLTLSDVP